MQFFSKSFFYFRRITINNLFKTMVPGPCSLKTDAKIMLFSYFLWAVQKTLGSFQSFLWHAVKQYTTSSHLEPFLSLFFQQIFALVFLGRQGCCVGNRSKGTTYLHTLSIIVRLAFGEASGSLEIRRTKYRREGNTSRMRPQIPTVQCWPFVRRLPFSTRAERGKL